jgi:hypothetical protein
MTTATKSTSKKQKRGIVLLIVLSLLALFVLLGITYAIVASKYQQGADYVARVEQIGDPLVTETDLVLGQLLHDTLQRTSLQGHSLLLDLYGIDSVEGMVSIVGNPGALGVFNYDSGQPAGQPGQIWRMWVNQPTSLSKIQHYYAGRVLTFIDGPAKNHSTRIIDSSFNPNDPLGKEHELLIEAIESKHSTFALPQQGNRFIINGAPFNGTGAGFDPIRRNLEAVLVNRAAIEQALSLGGSLASHKDDLVALLPHFAGYDMSFYPAPPIPQLQRTQIVWDASSALTGSNMQSADNVGFGGQDESWDAVDFQNMALAMVPPRAAEYLANNNLNDASTFNNDLPIIPSFHRPELINYWINYIRLNILESPQHNIMRSSPPGPGYLRQLQIIAFPYGSDGVRNTGDEPTEGSPEPLTLHDLDRIYNIMRGCIFRPMPWNHPNFTGSNPNFAATSAADIERLFHNLVNSPNPHFNPNYEGASAPQSRPYPTPFPAAQVPSASPPVAEYLYFPNRPIWDVDNDADGVPDSIWIDPGLPVLTTKSGRRVKRLAAILVKDLDGSIDLNAHGHLLYATDQRNRADNALVNIAPGYQPLPLADGFGGLGLAPQGANVPRGTGFGPAEVDFLNLLNNDVNAYGTLMLGRYEAIPFAPSPDRGVAARPGAPGVRDPLSYLKHYGIPDNYVGQSLWYASPPDVWGRGAVVLDVGGQPIWANTAPAGGEMLDTPYELVLSGQPYPGDWRYMPAELERLLRYHDIDAMNLPDRILRLAGNQGAGTNPLAPGYQAFPYFTTSSVGPPEPPGTIGVANARRNSFGMTSHIPAPATAIPQEVRQEMASLTDGPKLPGRVSILDLYYERILARRLAAGGTRSDGTPRYSQPLRPDEHLQLKQDMEQIVPWEFFKGQKFDVNRWLGNGFDDPVGTGNGVVDDPDEAGNEPVWPTLPTPPFFNSAQYANIIGNPANGVNVDGSANANGATLTQTDAFLARQLYARHLYCLVLLLGGEKFIAAQATDGNSFPQQSSLTQTEKELLLRRRLAQWAINCVDFRDPDSIMTPFEFDLFPFNENDNNPFNGTWDVDGWIGRSPGPDGQFGPGDDIPSPDDDESAYPYRKVVWGMEYPDLLITETLALHDRRVKDTDQAGPNDHRRTDTNPSNRDDDLDQFRVPQGTVVLELYCPRPTTWSNVNQQPNQKPILPRELYHSTGALDLGKRAPGGRAVWRLAFSALDASDKTKSAYTMAQSSQESASYDPVDVSFVTGGTDGPQTIERFAYFDNAANIPAAERANSFSNRSFTATNSPLLFPGSYAVIGPRSDTYFGSQDPITANPTAPTAHWGGNSKGRIHLDPSAANPVQVYAYGPTGNEIRTSRDANVVKHGIRPPLAIILDNNLPSDWTSAHPWRVGLNITEPLPMPGAYYPEPTVPIDTSKTGGAADFYDDPDVPLRDGTGFKDEPLDHPGGAAASTRPIARNNMTHTGTYTDCSTVYLQRLANPMLPYNPPPHPTNPSISIDPNTPYNSNSPPNPYITIDWATIDVTVFSGEENKDGPSGAPAPFDPDDDPASRPEMHFRTRQRGFFPPMTTPTPANPWPPLTFNGDEGNVFLASKEGADTGGAYFKFNLTNELYLPDTSTPPEPNQPVPPFRNRSSLTDPMTGRRLYPADYDLGFEAINSDPMDDRSAKWDLHTLGYLNEPINHLFVQEYPNGRPYTPPYQTPYVPYLGEPAKPFPWLTWNNRPFANAMELLLVPTSSSSRVCSEFVAGPIGSNPASVLQNSLTSDPYGTGTSRTDTPPNAFRSPFGHLFSFFNSSLNASDISNPNLPIGLNLYRLLDYVEVPSPFAGAERWYNPRQTLGTNLYGYPPPYIGANLFPPFNKMSRFRDPGRININTIFDKDVWDAAIAQFPPMKATDFAAAVMLSRQGYYRIPLDPADMLAIDPSQPTRFANPFRTGDSSDLMPPIGTLRKDDPVEATFMRSYPVAPGSAREGLFEYKSGAAHNDTNRNPYFRYQAFQKIGSLFTTQSNCYAVWITIGYFEVEDNEVQIGQQPKQIVFDAAHPDGLRLGQEVGADGGEISRQRAFYIIDRSIPVGFDPVHHPGRRLNTHDCILLRRLIE